MLVCQIRPPTTSNLACRRALHHDRCLCSVHAKHRGKNLLQDIARLIFRKWTSYIALLDNVHKKVSLMVRILTVRTRLTKMVRILARRTFGQDSTAAWTLKPLYHCTIVPLYHCTVVPLYHCPTVLLNRCDDLALYQCTVVSLYSCNLVPLYHCTVVTLYCFIVVLLYYCTF